MTRVCGLHGASAPDPRLRTRPARRVQSADGAVRARAAAPGAAAAKSAALPRNSGNRHVDALLYRPLGWWHEPGNLPAVGQVQVMPGVRALSAQSSRREIGYSFIGAETLPQEVLRHDFPAFGQPKRFTPMDAAQRAAVRAALDFVSAVTGLGFVEAPGGSGQIQLGTYDMDPQDGGLAGMAGVSNLPGAYPLTDKVYTFVHTDPDRPAGDHNPGSAGWRTIWHEVGHALGLKHPGRYDAAGPGLGGPFLPAALDNRQHSLMSYRDTASSRAWPL